MFDIVSAPSLIRVICSAYLLSTLLLLSFTTCGWWVIAHLEHQEDHLTKWFG